MVITDPILFLGCPPNPPHFMGVHQTLGICWVMHTGPPPGRGHISWVLTRPSWSAHLWMPTRMLTFVSRSHLPSWEAGSGCAPGRHLLHLLGAHPCIQIPLALMGGWIWMRARPSPTASSGCSPLFPDPSCPHGRMDLDARPAVTYCILWMLTFVSRSLLPSWEDGSGCAPGRHPMRPYLAHLATAPHCDLAHLVAVALGKAGLLSHHGTHLLPASQPVNTHSDNTHSSKHSDMHHQHCTHSQHTR